MLTFATSSKTLGVAVKGRGYIKRPLRGAGAPGLAKEEEASKEEEEPTDLKPCETRRDAFFPLRPPNPNPT